MRKSLRTLLTHLSRGSQNSTAVSRTSCAQPVHHQRVRLETHVSEVSKAQKSVVRLCIGVRDDVADAVRIYLLSIVKKHGGVLFPSLKEITIRAFFWETGMMSLWPQRMSLEKLQRLTVEDCDSTEILGKYVFDNFADGSLFLGHLAIAETNYDNETDDEMGGIWGVDEWLPLMLGRCKALTTLHITTNSIYHWHNILEGLKNHGPSLCSLSIHPRFGVTQKQSYFCETKFKQLAQSCCVLRYLIL